MIARSLLSPKISKNKGHYHNNNVERECFFPQERSADNFVPTYVTTHMPINIYIRGTRIHHGEQDTHSYRPALNNVFPRVS